MVHWVELLRPASHFKVQSRALAALFLTHLPDSAPSKAAGVWAPDTRWDNPVEFLVPSLSPSLP